MEPTAEAVPGEASRVWARPLVVLPVLAALALVGGQMPSFSTQAGLYTLTVGGAMVCLGFRSRPAAGPPSRPASGPAAGPVPRRVGPAAAWWLLPLGWFAAVEVATFIAGSGRYPTLSLIMDPLLENELVRSACILGWLAGFWALVRR